VLVEVVTDTVPTVFVVVTGAIGLTAQEQAAEIISSANGASSENH